MSIKSIALGASTLVLSSNINAVAIGVWGGDFSVWDSYLSASGDTAVSLSAASTASDFANLDQVWLIRENGDNDLVNYINNGGTLVTEWSGADWAVNTASLLDATTSSLSAVGFGTPVTFTQSGLNLGLGSATGNPYANEGATEFFYAFNNIGSSVDVIATINGNNVGIAGAYGNGYVVSLGWDWQDTANDIITQSLVNDITNISTVPVPAAAWLFGSGLLGLVGMARRKK